MTAAAATKPDRRRLAHLLRAARSPLDADGVIDLVAGVLAAPAEIGDSWHQLVADPTPPALAEALEELRAHMAAGYHDGLSREDFARLPRAGGGARPGAATAGISWWQPRPRRPSPKRSRNCGRTWPPGTTTACRARISPACRGRPASRGCAR